MREIKFRAWDGDEMVFGESISLDGYGSFNVFHPDADPNWFNSGCVLMQYTGLKDKNGKEIYEGDIVDFFDELIGNDRSGRYKVKYMPCSFYAEQLDEQHGMELFQEGGYYEVVGNIYENPELLNSEQEAEGSDTTKMPNEQKPD